MEEQGTSKQGGGGRMASTALLVFLLVYFLFPVLLVWPFFIAYGSGKPPPPAVGKFFNVFFWPVGYLESHVPPYRHLLQEEARWLGIH